MLSLNSDPVENQQHRWHKQTLHMTNPGQKSSAWIQLQIQEWRPWCATCKSRWLLQMSTYINQHCTQRPLPKCYQWWSCYLNNRHVGLGSSQSTVFMQPNKVCMKLKSTESPWGPMKHFLRTLPQTKANRKVERFTFWEGKDWIIN